LRVVDIFIERTAHLVSLKRVNQRRAVGHTAKGHELHKQTAVGGDDLAVGAAPFLAQVKRFVIIGGYTFWQGTQPARFHGIPRSSH
jgi:hypothetical protein